MELSALHELIGKELAGELTPEEREVLGAWQAQATAEEQLVYAEIRHYWQTPPVVSETEQAATAAALAHLLTRLDTPEPSGARVLELPRPVPAPSVWWRPRVAAAVAALALATAAGAWLYERTNGLTVPLAYQEHRTARGATAKVLLADGTAVWLNADSHLWYPKTFTKGQREVYLDGEALFEVQPNSRQPFLLHVGAQQIRVLGTSFNVKAYPEEPTVETAVVTGKVAFIRTKTGGAPDTAYLQPNQRAVYTKATATLRQQTVESTDYTAWRQGGLIFQATPLAEVARTLARTYNVRVQLDNDRLLNCRLTGRFRNQGLREVVSLLSLTGTFGFELQDKELRLTGPGCPPEETGGAPAQTQL